MNHWTEYALLSLGTGALYVLVASGIVVVARGAGVLNIAQGAMVAWAAYSFHGALEIWGLPIAFAGALAVLSTAGIGLAFHFLVMRPIEEANPVVRLMATLGLMTILLSSIGLMYGTVWRSSPRVLPEGTVTVVGTAVEVDKFVRLGVVLAVVAGLWAVFRFTTIGLATTAASENPRAAATYGWSPNMVAGLSWCTGGALAGVTGVLLAPLQSPLSSSILGMLVVPALAVALAARFRSFGVVLLGGLALSLVEAETHAQLPAWRGFDQAIPLLVIVFYLAFRGRGLPERGHVATRAHPPLGSGVVHVPGLVGALATTLALIWLVLPDDWLEALNANALWAMILLSVVVLVGFTGQLSLAQLSFAGIAALVAGRLVAVLGWPLEAALLVGVAATVPAGMLFALPALRTRGLQLAVVTLGLGTAVEGVLLQRGYHSPPPEDNLAASLGFTGDLAKPEGTVVGQQSLFGVDLNTVTNPAGFATLSLLAVVAVAIAVANLRRSRAGRRLIAVRTNERAAASLGIGVVGAKLYAFGLSAAIAGLGGVLYAFHLYGKSGNIDYGGGAFSPINSILLISFAVVGGVGWVSGAFAGSTLAAGALVTRLGAFLGAALVGLGWLLRTIAVVLGALVGQQVGRGLTRNRGAASTRVAPWLGAVALVAVALLVGPKLAGWLGDLESYVPLLGGVILVVVLARSKGGMAPETAQATRAMLQARWPERARRRAQRTIAAAVGDAGSAGQVGPVGGAGLAGGGAGPAAVDLVRPARLSVSGLTVRFGAVTALDGVALSVEPGTVVGLIGPNGAGKTTAIDAITGYAPAPAAFMALGGMPIDRLPPHRRARAGLSRSFQHLELFEDLTVLENIQAACDRRDCLAYLSGLVAPRNQPLPPVALAAIDAFGLREDLLRTVSELPYGRRRLLAVARAVAAGPSVLLLDEPCAGLDENESAEVVMLLRHLAEDWGLGILLNEHDMTVVMNACDRIVVLDGGKVIAEGTPKKVRRDPRVQLAYLGEQFDAKVDPNIGADIDANGGRRRYNRSMAEPHATAAGHATSGSGSGHATAAAHGKAAVVATARERPRSRPGGVP